MIEVLPSEHRRCPECGRGKFGRNLNGREVEVDACLFLNGVMLEAAFAATHHADRADFVIERTARQNP